MGIEHVNHWKETFDALGLNVTNISEKLLL